MGDRPTGILTAVAFLTARGAVTVGVVDIRGRPGPRFVDLFAAVSFLSSDLVAAVREWRRT